MPGTYVRRDVPPYAIVNGPDASVIEYRFSKYEVEQLLDSKWWLKDISTILEKYFSLASMDYADATELISRVHQAKLPYLPKRFFWINTEKRIFQKNTDYNIIVGPSHIDIWHKKSQKNLIDKPIGFHLFPISAVSMFSNQLNDFIRWWSEWMGKVILFVPDFRIGNAGMAARERDGRFISPRDISEKNSKECYLASISMLDMLKPLEDVRFWFWCLNGREEINKKNGLYSNSIGEYRHPLWNYNHLIKRYGGKVIDIKKYFPEVESFIVDGSIHPTDIGYKKMANIFEKYNWN